MQGLILAAGMGKRLKDLTKDNTKCMIRVNGITLIERMLRQLDELHLSRIVIVVGYEGQKLIDYIDTLGINTPIRYVNNPIYDKTNNIYSLGLAKEYLLKEDTLLLESDLIFEDSVLKCLIDDPRDTLALVDKYESWMDGTCIKIHKDDTVAAFIPKKRFDFSEINEYYKTVNIYKFSKEFSEMYYVPFLDAYTKALGDNEYYEQVLRVITMLDKPVMKVKRLEGQLWYEIDDIQDLDIAASMFAAKDDDKLALVELRYGGYWRYPRLLDYCYLVNPYFPPKKMIDEMQASFSRLLTQYPSGQRVNSLLAAKNFGVPQENILVGNGAAELIKALPEIFHGNFGFIRPTFEEYPNRYDKEKSISYIVDNKDYSYNEDDIISYFEDKPIDHLLIVNPDNPSGNYITKAGLMKLISWTKDKGIDLVVDESFVDFADEENTLVDRDLLTEYPHLIVIKSISKCYGVPGLRLGILASGNTELVARLKKIVAIWNINSFAEFYMQIEEKYHTTYKKGLVLFKAERERFVNELKKIPALRVIPSQANYLLIEITGGMTARELTKRMLKQNILIKDLTAKLKNADGQYIRIAIRDSKDNDRLLEVLNGILC